MRKAGIGCLGVIVLVIVLAGAIVAFMPDDDTEMVCMAAPDAIVADIAEGMNGAALTDAQMVRADDRENVWFVAGVVDGEVGVWATSRIDAEGRYTDTGLIYSVGDVANAVSDWGDGGRTDAELSITEDAAVQAQACVTTD